MATTTAKLVDNRLQIIYRLLNNLVVKQVKRANEDPNEPFYSKYFEEYMTALEQLDTIRDYPNMLDRSLLKYYKPDISDREIATILQEPEEIYSIFTFEEHTKLMTELRRQRVVDYVELNPYYRMLLGVPPINTPPEEFVYYKGKVVHEMNYGEILNLKRSGALDVIRQANPKAEYLKYIDKKINLIEARRAKQFEVIWSPKSDEFNVYREMYNRERKVWMTTYHQEHLTDSTDFNEAMELTILKLRAIIYHIIYSYTTPLGKTSFSREESEDLYKSFGLTFPQHMPDSYRNATTYVLNYLVMYKGTNYVLEFITRKLFSGLNLYKYFIRKRRKPNVEAKPGMKPEDLYDVDFILKPFRATNPYDDISDQKTKTYLTKDEAYNKNFENMEYSNVENSYKQTEEKEMILTYDEVKLLDPRWSDSDELKRAVFEEPFSYVESKYLAVDNIVDIHEITLGLSVVHRYFLKHRENLKRVNLTYNGTGLMHNFWDLWVYYNALITYAVSKFDDKPGDTVDWVNKIMGFETIKTHPTIRMYWLIVMAQYGYETILEKFPDAANSDTEFLQLLVNVNKAIGLTRFVDSVMTMARTHVEVDMIYELMHHVRIMSKEPEAYNTISTEEGQPYIDYLEKFSPELYAFYYTNVDNGINTIMLEIDNMTQYLINVVQNQDNDLDLRDLTEVFYSINMLFGGISKYLMYILKLFKAWRVEFISDGLLLKYNEKYEWQVNVDQITPDVKMNMPKVRWNVTQYDWIEIEKETDKDFCEKNRNEDALFLITKYGDIKLS